MVRCSQEVKGNNLYMKCYRNGTVRTGRIGTWCTYTETSSLVGDDSAIIECLCNLDKRVIDKTFGHEPWCLLRLLNERRKIKDWNRFPHPTYTQGKWNEFSIGQFQLAKQAADLYFVFILNTSVHNFNKSRLEKQTVKRVGSHNKVMSGRRCTILI